MHRTISILGAATLAACGTFVSPSSAYCENDLACPSGVCDTSSFTCQAPTRDAVPDAGDADGPRPCGTHGDCATGLCDVENATCVPSEAIVFVSPEGTPPPCGSRERPCSSLGAAIEQAGIDQRWIAVLAGNYKEQLVLDSGHDVAIIASAGAELTAPEESLSAITVDGGSVLLDGLDIVGSKGSGISCVGAPDADPGTVTLRNLRVRESARHAIAAEHCDLVLERVELVDNRNFAVYATEGSSLRVSRSRLSRNEKGLFLWATDLDIENSLIVNNGNRSDRTANFAMLWIMEPGPTGLARIRFTTVADNQVSDNAQVEGVYCSTPVTGENNIIRTRIRAVSDDCTMAYSNITGGVTGPGNIDADPRFTEGDQFRLSEDSPCIDAADPNADLVVDYHGNPRPKGTAADMGATEAR